MDRSMRDGTLGLTALWLSRGCDAHGRDDHVVDKVLCSSEAMFQERSAARFALEGAAASDSELRDMLESEARWRGGARHEPASLNVAGFRSALG